MNREGLLKHLVFLMFFIFIAHLFAQKFYWYYSIWYFDMPMHLLGGFLSGLFLIWVLSYKNISQPSSLKFILKIILGVLFIGILWEMFEFLVNNYVVKNLFLINNLDSLSDLFFDLSGGAMAIFYFLKRIMVQSQ